MATADPTPAAEQCARFGLPGDARLEQLRAGRNSQVWLVTAGNERWVLKRYAPSAAVDRAATEFAFLRYAEGQGISVVPRPIALDPERRAALYSFLPGRRPSSVSDRHVDAAGAFVRAINAGRGSETARQLGAAADACQSTHAHRRLATSRVERLEQLRSDDAIVRSAHEFVMTRLRPALDAALEGSTTQGDAELSPDEQILSPSDFGFHNALEHDGEVWFLDFEYAGWDDPAKLACDFACQPELPVTGEQAQAFLDALLSWVPAAHAVKERVNTLMPFHRIKWCCILLNEFARSDRDRRLHAGIDPEGLLESQLAKAVRYFDLHLASII